MAIELIDFRFKPLEISLTVPYIAQLTVYSAALYALKEWYYAQQDSSKWREFMLVVSKIKVFTINGI